MGSQHFNTAYGNRGVKHPCSKLFHAQRIVQRHEGALYKDKPVTVSAELRKDVGEPRKRTRHAGSEAYHDICDDVLEVAMRDWRR